MGVTPIDLVKDMRVKRAIQLLDSGNYNISQVAYMSGFSSPQYFSRVFKELKIVLRVSIKQKPLIDKSKAFLWFGIKVHRIA